MQGLCLNTQHSTYKGRYRHKIGDSASQEGIFDKGEISAKSSYSIDNIEDIKNFKIRAETVEKRTGTGRCCPGMLHPGSLTVGMLTVTSED